MNFWTNYSTLAILKPPTRRYCKSESENKSYPFTDLGEKPPNINPPGEKPPNISPPGVKPPV